MDKTLADYINRTMERLKEDKAPRQTSTEPVQNPNDYPVYPEDDGYDRPSNPYSSV